MSQGLRHIEIASKYPKTDYTYSHLSKDRVELAPGQVAMPNMSRQSLSQFRAQGSRTSLDEIDRMAATTSWTASTTLRQRFSSFSSFDDKTNYLNGNGYRRAAAVDQRWWITRILMAIVTTITTTTSNAYRSLIKPSHRYPYTYHRVSTTKASLVSRTTSLAAVPFSWIYSVIKKMITTIVTTVTETVASKHVTERRNYHVQRNEVYKKRSLWPWFFLLLLPIIGYGCYSYQDQILPQKIVLNNYESPKIDRDQELSERIAVLEDWAEKVDTKLKFFDSEISQVDNLGAQIEQYSFKYLQQNLIHIFNDKNSDAISAKLKTYFDQFYLSKEQMQVIIQEIHERLIDSWKPELGEDKIRQMIQEYLSVFERQQIKLIGIRIREYIKKIDIHHTKEGIDVEAVKRIVAGMLDVYDADKTGLVDYALESAGGQVISTKCTELYQIKTKQYSILGLPVWWVYTSPRFALTPGAMPAECWAFQGFPGYLVVRTYAVIEVTGFSVEHMSRLLAVEGKIESAPKKFSVYGLHGELDPVPHLFGNYVYDANGTAIQYFPVQYPKTTVIGGVEYPVAYDIIELRVESNYGNPTYTCVYRFRVHGNPLSDIRQATEDSMRDSET